MSDYFSAAVLSAALFAPVVVNADNRREVRRYYDRDRRDWHEWDERESEAYIRYLADTRRNYQEFAAVDHRDQQAYWKWRHTHP